MSKHALVVNGGISRGAFAVGAIQKIFEQRPELEFDVFSGSGAGSLVIPFVALKDMNPLVEIFTTKHNRDIVRKFSLSERLQESSILDAGPLWSLLDHYYTHQLFDRLRASDKSLYFNTMCLQTHALTVFSPRHNPVIASRYDHRCIDSYDQFLRTLLASTCQPVLMPPIRIHPQEEPVRQYIDAGDRDYAGIEMAIASGATDVYVLLQSPAIPTLQEKEYNDLYSILQETLDIFISDVALDRYMLPNLYNEGLRYIQEVKRKMSRQGIPAEMIDEWFDTGTMNHPFYDHSPVNLHIIRPDQPLGGGPDGLNFDPVLMQAMLKKGEQAMEAHLARMGEQAPASTANTQIHTRKGSREGLRPM